MLASLAALLVVVPSALSATVSERPLLFTFNGRDTSAGPFTEPNSIAVDNQTGDVYVAVEGNPSYVAKFNPNGEPADFSATGSPVLQAEGGFTSLLGVAVDNSGGPNQGRILVSQWGPTRFQAFAPSGDPLWTQRETFGQISDITADAAGHPWTSKGNEYENSAGAPERILSLGVESSQSSHIEVDADGNVYLTNGFDSPVEKYVGGALNSILDPSATDVYADQSSADGHIFTSEEGAFTEFNAAGTEVGTSGVPYIGSGRGIAYNPTLDRVYVLQSGAEPLVAAFGAPQTGTVGDATIEDPSAVGVGTAHFSGSVNPQGTSSEWRFEWKHPEEGWDAASSSPPQSLPADSSSHAVSYTTNALRGAGAYEVRLVAVNTTTKLAGFSAAKSFETEVAGEAPVIAIAAPGPLNATTATISGTIDPKGDTAGWVVQLSTDPSCAGGFTDQRPQALQEASSSPVGVSYELTGLLPTQRYCARISATNSAGSNTSEVKEFETVSVLPDQVQTAFVAPRFDTSARLNGRVNPHGAALTYHFEYSADGGSTWTALPDQSDTSRSRQQIVVSQELSGLTPDTTYSYRFTVEDSAGPASPQGEELTFTTRTSAEVSDPQSCPNEDPRAVQHASYLGDCRALELVNQPNKGNQNILTNSPPTNASAISENGEAAVWSVFGGAPGGNAATGASFLARRTPSGWQSKSLVPPVSEQLGGGEYSYTVQAATPDFSKFILMVAKAKFTLRRGPTFLRSNGDQDQEILNSEPTAELVTDTMVDITNNGSHVLLVNPETHQLEDIGSGTPEIVSLMPDGSPSSCPLGTEGQSFIEPSAPGEGAGANWRPGYHRIATDDASRVYFEVSPVGRCEAFRSLQLYQRNRETETTTLIDPGVEGISDPHLVRATPDGRSVYFVTGSSLDPADTNGNLDVYRWDEESDESHCLTCVVPNAELSTPSVMVSDDFSHIYFESSRQLFAGEGSSGGHNLYVLSHGEIRFVSGGIEREGVLAYGLAPSAELSPNGDVLVFFSEASRELTSDSIPAGCPNAQGETFAPPSCPQLYRYDDRDGSLECVSCVAGGVTTNGVGKRELNIRTPTDFRMSSDGNTVAFVTASALVPRDVNRGIDIYEWHDGARHLVTDGVGRLPLGGLSSPAVRAVSSDGRDIFFSDVDPRTGFEQDGLANLYDARIDGGFMPPNPPVHCSEESCQGPLQPAPQEQRPDSPTINSLGNQGRQGSHSRCAGKHGKAKRRCSHKKKQHKHHKKQGKSRSRNSGTRHDLGGAK